MFIFRKRNKRSSNGKIFIINLALSDMLNLIINIPLKAISNLSKGWIFGKAGIYLF